MKKPRLFQWAALRRLFLSALMLWAMAAQAQITVQTVTLPTNIGRGQVVDVDITWLRNAVGAGNDAISTQLAPQVQVQPPALPAGCSLSGSNVICAIGGGGGVIGDHGHIIFQVQGALIGGFNLTATASNLAGAPLGGSSATGSGNVTSAGDLTVGKTKSSPAGNPIAGQTTVFVVTPQLSGGADDVPASGQIVVTDNLPGTSTDYALTNVSTSGLSPACTATGTANTTRTLTCTYSGPFTAAQLNASSITLTGTPGTNGSFTNVASIASGNPNYYDSNPLNNITNLNYTVDVGSDLQAQGSFPAGAVMVSSAQSLTITYRNNGPLNSPVGGTVAVTIPAGFGVGVMPSGCVKVGAGPYTVTCTTTSIVNSGNVKSYVIPLTMPATATSGNFPVTVTPPAGFLDYNLANNSVNVPYSVVTPFADLVAGKTKAPGGPQPAGTVVTSTLTITNSASSTSNADYTPAQPLRIVDYLRPEEASGGTISGVTAGWTCNVATGIAPPAPINAQRTTQVSCFTTGTGSLAPGASTSVSFSSTITLGGSVVPIALQNTACTGSTALTQLGVWAAEMRVVPINTS